MSRRKYERPDLEERVFSFNKCPFCGLKDCRFMRRTYPSRFKE